MPRTNIYFITGVNSAGKSTLVPLLRDKLPNNFLVYDFDERGVPENVNSTWRKKETKYWLLKATRNAKKGSNTIVCGLTLPNEIYSLSKNVKIILLDISSQGISQRLKIRFKSQPSIRNLKKVTGLTVDKCIKANILRAQELRKQARQYKIKVFNTSRTTPLKTAEKIVDALL